MYRDVTQWTRIRRRALTGGVSQRRITRDTGISRQTVRKMIEFPIPPGYQRKRVIDRPKLRLFAGLIYGIVKEDQGKPKKQRHTASRIWEWLKENHDFTGGYTIVKNCVREARRTARGLNSDPAQLALSQDTFEPADPAELTYEFIQSVSKREAIKLLRVMFGDGAPQVRDVERLNRPLGPFAKKETRGARRLRARQSAFDWMRKVLQGEVSLNALAGELGELSGVNELLTVVTEGRLSDRNRALAVLARERGFCINDVRGFLNLSKASVLKYGRRYKPLEVGQQPNAATPEELVDGIIREFPGSLQQEVIEYGKDRELSKNRVLRVLKNRQGVRGEGKGLRYYPPAEQGAA